MKKSVLLFSFVAGITSAFAAEELSLAGVWHLQSLANAPLNCPVQVPGDVHTALYAAKIIPDPYWGCNETNVQWVAKEDWVFTRTFDVSPAFLAKRRIVLEMEDVDTFADIYVNGKKIGTASDRFARWTFDAKPVLKAGRNEIRAVFKSAWIEADRRAAAIGRKFPMSNVPWAKNQALIRKPACHAGWDWGLAQMTTGFCGPVKLVAHDGRKIDYVYTDQKFNADFTRCDLTVYADVTEADGRELTVTNRVVIDNPPLWWPNGAGKQQFYTYAMDEDGNVVGSAESGQRSTTRHRVGLRKIEVVNTPDVDAKGKKGARMAVKVNGRELFMKGANWIPCDAFESRQTVEKYRNLLGSAAAANMNMVRLWGGGQFEHDAFYDVCDELGILVWHDQMFSCAVYPADEQFISEVRNELCHQVRRLRDHASIALWCGDNECVGALTWFGETKGDSAYYKQALVKRHAVQDEMVAKYDPARMFWPSSPCAGPGNFADNWKNDSQGDMHNWQVWHENCPFDAYYAYSPRFCSEFGYQSFPSMEVAETFATRKQVLARAPEFEWHQKNPGGNRRMRETMLRYFQPPKDVESELLLSQFQQGMAIKMAVDGWRAQRPRCMGTLFWQLNDNWPVASWSSIEYGGKWKPLQYMAKRFYEPVAVVAQPEITDGKADVTKGKVYALNDTAEPVKGELLVEYWTYDGKIVSADKKSVTLPPDSSTEVSAFDARMPKLKQSESQAVFLVLTLKTEKGTYQNDWHFGFYKDMPLACAKIDQTLKQSDGQTTLTLSTDKPAFFVWADEEGVPGEFSDNCFTLLPGRPKSIRCKPGMTVSSRVSVRHLRAIVQKEPSKLYGDGVHDDTAAIQELLDSGAACVRLPTPKVRYLISRPLVIGSDTELRLDRFAEVRLAPKSNCLMLRNRNFAKGDRHIALVGGIWNFDNANQFPNPGALHAVDSPWSTTRVMPPKSEWPTFDSKEHPDGYNGMGLRFENVKDFIMRDVTIRNPATYAICAARISYFVIDGVEFDFTHYNPRRCNMDGIHLDGGCHHGKISNLRGACHDDLLAFNCNDGGHSVGEGEPITDIDVDGIYSEDCHSAVRMLSTGGKVRRINIRNIHGTFYRYAVGITHFFDTDERGTFDAISISDCHVAKIPHPDDIGWDMPRMPVIYVDSKLDIGSLTISNVTRDETRSAKEPTIAIYRDTKIARLTVRDCQQINRTNEPLEFIRCDGKIDSFIHENTRLVAAPGRNVLFSDEPIAGRPPR